MSEEATPEKKKVMQDYVNKCAQLGEALLTQESMPSLILNLKQEAAELLKQMKALP